MRRIRLLGTVDVLQDGLSIGVIGTRPKTVLAALALDQGRVVGRERLIDAIWERDPPASAPTQVAILISKLRRVLADPGLIETVDHGYRLSHEGCTVDAHEAEALLRRAREEQAPELFRRALRMWQWPVLAGLDGSAMIPAAQHYEEVFLAGVEDWAALEIDSSGGRNLLDVLPDVLARHPLHEGLRARLMEALWHNGRRADALRLYDEGRALLVEELGLDPGDQLARLQERILREEAASPPSRRAAEPMTLSRVADDEIDTPRQLPMDVPLFTGRTETLALLCSALDADPSQGALVAVHGVGGVGKTALVVHSGHRLLDRFPDGQLFLNLRGHGTRTPVDPGTALGSMLRGLGLPEQRIPADTDDRSRLLRSMLADRRMLVVLDNARDSYQIRPLLPGGRNVVVVTSRSQLRSLASLEAAHRLSIGELSPDEAVDLLRARLDPYNPEHRSDADLFELARLCGHLPVALAVAVERKIRYPDQPLSEFNTALRNGSSLDALTAWEDDPATSVRAILSSSYQALGEEEARLFRLLGLHPHPCCDRHVAASMIEREVGTTSRLLDRLVECSLLSERHPGHFEMHDLVHAYSSALAVEIPAPENDDATRRMRTTYLHSMMSVARSFDVRPYDYMCLSQPRDITIPPLGDFASARTWFDTNVNRITNVLHQAIDASEHDYVARLAYFIASATSRSRRHGEARALAEIGYRSARSVRDLPFQATFAMLRGTAVMHQGDFDTAAALQAESRRIFNRLGEPAREMAAAAGEAICLKRLGRSGDALELLRTYADSEGAPPLLLNSLAQAQLPLGLTPEAVTSAARAVSAAEQTGERYLLGMALDTLSEAQLAAGAPEPAHEAAVAALAHFREISPGSVVAIALRTRGNAEAALGRHDAARDSWRQALELVDGTDASDELNITRDSLVKLLADSGETALSSSEKITPPARARPARP